MEALKNQMKIFKKTMNFINLKLMKSETCSLKDYQERTEVEIQLGI